MKKQIKKGFTLVELLVVIAIIAILSVVSVVGYTSFTKKAKVSNDVSLTKQMNTILDASVAEGKVYATPHEAVVDLEDGGLVMTKLTPTSDDYIFVLNINAKQGEKVLLLDENYKVKAPEGAILGTNKADYFTFVSSSKEITKYSGDGYSVYLKDSYKDSAVTVSSGIDVGNNSNVCIINYSNTNAKTAIVRTNGGVLNINAENDTIKHYGSADKVNVTAVASESYHEYGKVDTVSFAKGRFVAESSAEVSFVNVTAINVGDVKAIEVKTGAEVIAVTASSAANVEALKKVVTGNSTVYNQTDLEDKMVYVNNNGSASMYDTIAAAIESNKNATIKLLKDVAEDIVIPSDANIVLDLNGKTITNVNSDTIKVLLNGKLTINGKGVVDVLTHDMACILNNGTTILNGGKYTRSKEASTSTESSNGNSYYNILNHGEMTINDGVEVYSTGAFSSLIVSGYYGYSKIESGEKKAYIEGTNMAEPKLTINGGTFSGGKNTIKIDDGSIVTINDGTFKNTTQAVIFNVNKVYINGGTFDMPSSADIHYSVESRNSSVFPNDVYTEIRGGVFNGSIINDSADATKLVIYGGTFNNSFLGAYTDNRNK